MSYLLKPLTTGKLPLKNRLVMPPMATSKAGLDGRVSQALLDYYDEKSRGGAIGLVITEHNYITKQGQNRAGQPSAAADAMIAGLSRLAEVIHRNGSKTALQINHVGGTASTAVTGFDAVGPSGVPNPGDSPDPTLRALTSDEIAAEAKSTQLTPDQGDARSARPASPQLLTPSSTGSAHANT